MRCMHEASLYEENCFITLTYDDDHLPVRGSLDYSEFQRFLKRLRKFAEPKGLRFYMCGEYGELNWRPHYHACIFGFDLPDKQYLRTTESGERLYASDTLSRLWPCGHSSVGSLTFQSAAYVARYCVAKRTGPQADAWYARSDADGHFQLVPEFNHMSLRPGIGAPWLARYQSDVFPRDYVVINGVQCRVPDYYDKLFGRVSPLELDELKAHRVVDALARVDDNTEARLLVKETVQRARSSLLLRSLTL